MNPIIDAAQALAGLLRAAEEAGLPLPSSGDVSQYAPHGHVAGEVPPHFGRGGGIQLYVDTFGDLAAWSTWLDSPIDDSHAGYKGKIHCRVSGMAGPVPVRVTALVAAEPLLAEVRS